MTEEYFESELIRNGFALRSGSWGSSYVKGGRTVNWGKHHDGSITVGLEVGGRTVVCGQLEDMPDAFLQAYLRFEDR